MEKLIATVRNGRLILDAPTDLPDGAQVPVEIGNEWDELDAAEREELHAALRAAWARAKRGELVPGDDLMRELRARG